MNNMKTTLLLATLTAILVVLGDMIGGRSGMMIMFIISMGMNFMSYWFSDKIVLAQYNAQQVTAQSNPKLYGMVERLAKNGKLPMPKVYIIPSEVPNAFATGRNPKHSVICVTTGLLNKLDYYELEGVVAHELSHIKNYDIRLSAVVTVMVGFIVMLSDFVSRMLFWGGGSSDDNDSKGGNPILMIIGLICLILAPIFGNLMKLALSRRREYLADASAVELTRNPDGLISALEKISADPDELKTANKATANMYIVNPFKGEKKKKQSNIWSTHPATEDRIEAIRNLK